MSQIQEDLAERRAAEFDRVDTLARRHKVSIRTIERWYSIGICRSRCDLRQAILGLLAPWRGSTT